MQGNHQVPPAPCRRQMSAQLSHWLPEKRLHAQAFENRVSMGNHTEPWLPEVSLREIHVVH
jgi:hypothetical protein